MTPLSFEGNGSEYFRIWIVNILLTIVTLGLYYPWAKVRNRRYFYANTRSGDRSFEYHATGKQLFPGYIIAMGMFIIYVLAQELSPTLTLVLVPIYFIAVPWIIWRSLMFNMRVTSFSNVRFGFAGSLQDSYLNFVFLPLSLMVIAIIPLAAILYLIADSPIVLFIAMGLYAPIVFTLSAAVVKKNNSNYLINGYRFGQGEFNVELDTKAFFIILLKTLGVSILVYGLFTIILAVVMASMVGFGDLSSLLALSEGPGGVDLSQNVGSLMATFAGIAFFYIAMICSGFFILSFMKARERDYIFENMKLDDHVSFSSTLETLPLAWTRISNLLLLVVTLGLAMPWTKVRIARLIIENTHVNIEAGFDEYMTQQEDSQSALGDQLGDAFDIDMDVGF